MLDPSRGAPVGARSALLQNLARRDEIMSPEELLAWQQAMVGEVAALYGVGVGVPVGLYKHRRPL